MATPLEPAAHDRNRTESEALAIGAPADLEQVGMAIIGDHGGVAAGKLGVRLVHGQLTARAPQLNLAEWITFDSWDR